MSERVFIFIASGEACATCEGLHGTEVPAGFTPMRTATATQSPGKTAHSANS